MHLTYFGRKYKIKLDYSCNKKNCFLCVYIKLGFSVPCEFACVYRQLMRCIEPKKQNETAAAHKGDKKREKSLQELISHAAYPRNTEQGSFLSRFEQVCFLQRVSVYVLHLHDSLDSCARSAAGSECGLILPLA